jgi:hypothetical protein
VLEIEVRQNSIVLTETGKETWKAGDGNEKSEE